MRKEIDLQSNTDSVEAFEVSTNEGCFLTRGQLQEGDEPCVNTVLE